jgi:hypothetical protein
VYIYVSYLGGDLHIQEQTVESPVARPQAVALGGSSCVIAARERKRERDMIYRILYITHDVSMRSSAARTPQNKLRETGLPGHLVMDSLNPQPKNPKPVFIVLDSLNP